MTRVLFAWPKALRSKVRYALPETSSIFSANFGMSTYKVSLGLASEGVSVIRFSVDLAFIPKGSRGALFGFNFSETAICCSDFFLFLRVTVKLLNETTWWTK